MRVYTLSIRNRFLATLIVLGLIGLGAAVLFVGFALLAGIAVTGAVVGTGVSIYNRLRGRSAAALRSGRLDSRLEVFPEQRSSVRAIAPATDDRDV